MENRNCQNCKKDFVIEPDDFSFYEKIKVPPPTFCPWCRFIRRMLWRNERILYKRSCDLCKKSIIATYPEKTTFPVYCKDCWHGDGWDPSSFAQDYDFTKPFFTQFLELQNKVPRFALWQRNVINSEYANMTGESRNVYLSVSVVMNSENVFYSKGIDASSNIVDSYNIKHSEQCYENIEGSRNYNSQYLLLSRNCLDSYFLLDCANCSNCFMSSNLRNKQFYFRNKPYSKEDYFNEIKKFNLGSRAAKEDLLKEFKDLKENSIYRFANLVQTHGSTGNNLSNAKNCINAFDGYDIENFKYTYRAFNSKDFMDCDYAQVSELMYEYLTGALNDYNVRFSYNAMGNVRDAEYSDSCFSCNNIFGCISMRSKENSILNKVYSKEEFIKLRGEIVKHMNEMPYVDQKGRVYKYGEFFPMEIAPYAYNESPAQDFEPLTKASAEDKGYKWKDTSKKDYTITIQSADIPDDIKDIEDGILKEVLGCQHKNECHHQCSVAFRITEGELQFYKKHNIPLPDKCPNCRYYERFAQVPLPKLYKRTCMKCNKVEFETPYSPDRPEKVYCESCYNKEVY